MPAGEARRARTRRVELLAEADQARAVILAGIMLQMSALA
jgi:hypothetical protein